MSTSKYVTTFEMPGVEEFFALRSKIGRETTDFDMVKNSLENSLFHVVIRDNQKLTGMARIVGDGAMYFYIQDVVVDSDYQNQGVGISLMEQIERYLLKFTKKGSSIGLLAAKGKEGFYTRFNYTQRQNTASYFRILANQVACCCGVNIKEKEK